MSLSASLQLGVQGLGSSPEGLQCNKFYGVFFLTTVTTYGRVGAGLGGIYIDSIEIS